MVNKSSRNKVIIGVSLCVIISLVIILILNTINNNEREREELRVRRIEMSEQLFYARDMFFDNNMSIDFNWLGVTVGRGEAITPELQEISDVVFVHSEAEAVGFPDDVVVGWQSEYSELFLEWLANSLAIREIEELDITLPLTLETLVDSWEILNGAWRNSDRFFSSRRLFNHQRGVNEDSIEASLQDNLNEETEGLPTDE